MTVDKDKALNSCFHVLLDFSTTLLSASEFSIEIGPVGYVCLCVCMYVCMYVRMYVITSVCAHTCGVEERLNNLFWGIESQLKRIGKSKMYTVGWQAWDSRKNFSLSPNWVCNLLGEFFCSKEVSLCSIKVFH